MIEVLLLAGIWALIAMLAYLALKAERERAWLAYTLLHIKLQGQGSTSGTARKLARMAGEALEKQK